MPTVATEILEFIRQDLLEMKGDIKITKEQAIRTNGRANLHDAEIAAIKLFIEKFSQDKENEHEEIISEYKQKKKMIANYVFKFLIGVVVAIAAANQLPEFVVKSLQLFSSIYE